MTPNHVSSASLRVSVVIPALAEEQTIADAVGNAFAAGRTR
ncbi:MAG TPA: hypothetical protein QGI71_05160 [Dehalococcoidia bacterium]|nr:hypothetical protein [Dehalococcoidia bacterium]